MKGKKKYLISSPANQIRIRKRKNTNKLILLSHNICVEGLSKQRAEETIHNYIMNIKDYMEMEKEIKGYKIHHYIAITSAENQGISLLYPQMKYEVDNLTKQDGYTTDVALDRLSKVYSILKGE